LSTLFNFENCTGSEKGDMAKGETRQAAFTFIKLLAFDAVLAAY